MVIAYTTPKNKDGWRNYPLAFLLAVQKNLIFKNENYLCLEDFRIQKYLIFKNGDLLTEEVLTAKKF